MVKEIDSRCPRCGDGLRTVATGLSLITCGGCATSVLAATATLAGSAPAELGTDLVDTVPLDPAFQARYQIQGVLGAGTNGVVYRAHYHEIGQDVAIKFLRQPESENALARFLQEGRVLHAIRHPHVVRVFEVGAVGIVPYQVSEFVSGGTLREHMRPAVRMEPVAAVRLMRDILAGIGECHSHGIVHRDLKPENILVDSDGRAKIADLGTAKDYSQGAPALTVGVGLIGTPRYMAPEQLRYEPAVISSDLYAAGLIFYELLSGNFPFRVSSLGDLLKPRLSNIVHLQATLPMISEPLVKLIAWMLEPSVPRRPQSVSDVVQMLDVTPVLRNVRPLPVAEVRPVQARNPAVHSRRNAYRIGVPLLILCLAAAFFVIQYRRHSRQRLADEAEAQRLYVTKDLVNAEVLLRRLLQQTPDVGSLLELHGATLAELHRMSPALVDFQRAVRLYPHHRGYRRHLIRCLFALKRWTEARPFVELAVQEAPPDAELLHLWTELAGRLDLLKEYVPLIERVAAVNPDNGDLWRLLIDAYGTAGKFAEQDALTDRLYKDDRFRYTAWMAIRQAQRLGRHGDTLGATEAMRRGFQMHPKDPELSQAYGNALCESGHTREGLAILRDHLSATPSDPAAYRVLGDWQNILGFRNEALATFRRAARAGLLYPDLEFRLDLQLVCQGLLPSADVEKDILRLGGDRYVVGMGPVAVRLQSSGRVIESLLCARAGLSEFSAHTWCLYLICQNYHYICSSHELEYLTQGLKEAPHIPQAYVNLCCALARSGRIAEADAFILQAEKNLKPSDLANIRKQFVFPQRSWNEAEFSESFRIVQTRENCIHFLEFLRSRDQLDHWLATKEPSLFPQLGPATQWMLRAELDLQKGQAADAVRCYRTAIDNDPGSAQYYTGLSAACLSAGRIPEALTAEHRAHQLTTEWDFH